MEILEKLHKLNKDQRIFSDNPIFENIHKQKYFFDSHDNYIYDHTKTKILPYLDEKLKKQSPNDINVNDIIPIKYDTSHYNKKNNARQNSNPICLMMNKIQMENKFKDNNQLKNSKYYSLITPQKFRSNTVIKMNQQKNAIDIFISEKKIKSTNANHQIIQSKKKENHKSINSSPNNKLNQ